MPSSTLLQLVAKGAQDAYLTGSPQMTFFRHVYRRYANFAIESIPIEFDGSTEFGRRISVLVPRKGDLLSQLFLEVELPPIPQPTDPTQGPVYWVNDIGHALISDVSIEIGEVEIDKQTGDWLHVWGELTTSADKRDGYDAMTGHWNVYPPPLSVLDPSGTTIQVTVPLLFWFCQTIGAALPLLALQSHPIRIILNLRPFNELWWNPARMDPTPACTMMPPVSPSRFQLYGDFVFLEEDQRRFIAAAKHEYLIRQVQISPAQSIPAGTERVNLNISPFNHCCTEFIWTIQEERMMAAREWFNYSNVLKSAGGEVGVVETDLLASAVLRLDGYERFERRNAQHFRITQPYQRHTAIPTSPAYIYLYSFSLRPEDEQPSGSLNCSRINDIYLNLALTSATSSQARHVVVYAVNYNVLRIEGGMGGLAFIA